MPTKDYRAALQRLMKSTIADELANANWTYVFSRPMPVPTRPWKKGAAIRGDCSKGVQYLCWWVGIPADPMGMDWGPSGNSQTLCTRLQHLDTPTELKVGDVVTFGRDGDAHATMVLEAGADPLLWSFGHQGAPNSYRLSQDGRPAQYLRLPVPDPIPTPDDRLRARTGWFAWVAWRLGEGDWAGRGTAAAGVRPNVPKLVPPAWWSRYVRFLLNRKRGNPPTS